MPRDTPKHHSGAGLHATNIAGKDDVKQKEHRFGNCRASGCIKVNNKCLNKEKNVPNYDKEVLAPIVWKREVLVLELKKYLACWIQRIIKD